MKAYVLWAREFYQQSADGIRAERVFLKTGGTKPYGSYDEELQELEAMIPRESGAMNASYEYGDFPARSSLRECLSGTFAEVCP